MASPHLDDWTGGDFNAMVDTIEREMLRAGGRPVVSEAQERRENPLWGRGDVSPDVGLLDPVDALAGTLANPLLGGVKRVGTALTEPGPSLRGGLLSNQRGAIGDVTTEAQRLNMARSARSKGPIGEQPTVVTRATMERTTPEERILDYGAGKGIRQTEILREAGYKSVTPYDLPESIAMSEGRIQPLVPGSTYDTVMASNVLNKQPHKEAVEETLREITAYMRPEGRAIFNYPKTPRDPGLTVPELETLLRKHFRQVARIGGTNEAPVFEGLFPITGGQ